MMFLESDKLLLSFRKTHTIEEVSDLISTHQLVLETSDTNSNEESTKDELEINNTDKHFWVRAIMSKPINVDELYRDSKLDIEWIGPVYGLGKNTGTAGFLSPLPNVLLIKTKSKNKINKDTKKIFKEFGLREVTEKSKYLLGWKYFVISNPSKNNSYEIMSSLIAKKNLGLQIVFENMPMIKPLCSTPNDTYYSDQWNLVKISDLGFDLFAENSSVIICILDSGCDLNHPDLNIRNPGINLGTMQPDGSPTIGVGGRTSKYHGTGCAGIAAAKINNGIGIAGVAGGCQILPLACYMWTDAEIVCGITYAVDHGAKVINMSFGVVNASDGAGSSGWHLATIDTAIENAHASGVIMCAATGNDDSGNYIRYPARHPLVIACGASDHYDNRLELASTINGSNYYGTEVSVVAPGVDIRSTDIQGTDGSNQSPSPGGDYLWFSGTSAATPHVAGLAALLFHVNRKLGNTQVRNIIELTADKVGLIPYVLDPAYPNGSRNPEMGHGRINVARAVDYAKVLKSYGTHLTSANKIIGSLADGDQYVFTTHGIKHVPPWNPITNDVHKAVIQIVEGLIKLEKHGKKFKSLNSKKLKRRQTKSRR